jgi:large subunit ribosomal protein L20
MVRISYGKTTLKRHKKFLKLAKGYRGINSSSSTYAHEQVKQSLANSYIGRKLKKRELQTNWITQIQIALNNQKINYSKFIGNLRRSNILLNKKILASLTAIDHSSFIALARTISTQ